MELDIFIQKNLEIQFERKEKYLFCLPSGCTFFSVAPLSIFHDYDLWTKSKLFKCDGFTNTHQLTFWL